MATLTTVEPATGAAGPTWTTLAPDAIAAALAQAETAQAAWRATPVAGRAKVLRAVAGGLRGSAAAHAEQMARTMGKPVTQGLAEILKCAAGCVHVAEHGPGWLAPRPVATDATRSYVRADPLGVVLAIMPWNFPFWQVLRVGAPALLAGNALLIKHAPITFGCAAAIAEAFVAAGAPPGLVTDLRVDVADVPGVIADPRVAAVTFTGSTRAGAAVAALAGQHCKKSVLELGGSDPFIVCADADVEQAATVGGEGRLANAGQSCISPKRFLVERPVADAFVERLREIFAGRAPGDPLDPATRLGPLARPDLRDTLHAQVAASVAGGARALCGGALPDGPGCFYPPTVLVDVGPGHRVWDEEAFGPVAAVHVVDDAAQAVALANASPYGLGASVWTADLERAEQIAAALDTGGVFVNTLTRSDPRLPFGGVKQSGYGRELGELGIHEFVNHKTVWVD